MESWLSKNQHLWRRRFINLSFILLSFTINVDAMEKIPQEIISAGISKNMLPKALDSSLTIDKMRYNSPVSDNRQTYKPINNNVIKLSFLGFSLSKLIDPELYQNIWNNGTQFGEFIINTIQEHTKATLLSLAGSIYIMLNARLMYLQTKLNYLSYWSEWRSNITIEELYLIPQQTLYNDLLTNIQTKYTNFKNFRDNLAPLSNFLEDIDQEETYIRHYEAISKVLKSLHINNFTFYNHRLHKSLERRLNRLLFLKNSFLHWYAERKLNPYEKELLFRRFPNAKNMIKSETHFYPIETSLLQPKLQPKESTELILENIVKK